MVPKEGLEPSIHHWNTILSRARIPFRHFGTAALYSKFGVLHAESYFDVFYHNYPFPIGIMIELFIWKMTMISRIRA